MKILNSDGSKFYDVTPTSCNCPDYTFRQVKVGGQCKHMIRLFDPTKEIKEDIKDMRTFFKDGVDIDESYDKFGDTKIKMFLQTGEITKFRGKFVLLE